MKPTLIVANLALGAAVAPSLRADFQVRPVQGAVSNVAGGGANLLARLRAGGQIQEPVALRVEADLKVTADNRGGPSTNA